MGQHDSSLPRGFQRRFPLSFAILLFTALVAIAVVIGRAARDGDALSGVTATKPRIVSLLPQATDILVSIGCGDHLVGVSNYDADPEVAHLPHVGDYQTIDWEKIARVEPQWIITHYNARFAPRGFIDRADALGAQRFNVVTETLDGADKTLTVFHAIDELGRLCNEPEKAARASVRLRARLDAVRTRAAGEPPVRGLIVIDSDCSMVAGKDTFLNELFELAGGVNAAENLKVRYPQVDPEQILAMQPDVIVHLLPNAQPQIIAQARRFWSLMPNVPAVKNGRVVELTGWYVELPGYHVGDIAEQFLEALHPGAKGRP